MKMESIGSTDRWNVSAMSGGAGAALLLWRRLMVAHFKANHQRVRIEGLVDFHVDTLFLDYID